MCLSTLYYFSCCMDNERKSTLHSHNTHTHTQTCCCTHFLVKILKEYQYYTFIRIGRSQKQQRGQKSSCCRYYHQRSDTQTKTYISGLNGFYSLYYFYQKYYYCNYYFYDRVCYGKKKKMRKIKTHVVWLTEYSTSSTNHVKRIGFFDVWCLISVQSSSCWQSSSQITGFLSLAEE